MTRYFLNVVVVLLFFLGCTEKQTPPLLKPGKGKFVFQNDTLNHSKPINVFTYLPARYRADSPVLFVMHGNGRTAQKYRDAWVEIAKRNNALLLVPEFNRKRFPLDQDYNMGHMFKMDSLDRILGENPENLWSYSLIEPIFDFVVQRMKNKSSGYLIYGHSAGSQFVHRFLFFKPNAKVKKAVCANAGWYTFPDFKIPFPYGLKGTRCTPGHLKKVFAKPVTILLGDRDIDPNHPQLRRTPQAMKQGRHRFERGHNFFAACKKMADSLRVPFNWDLQIVPGVAHSNAKMAPAAGDVLFGTPGK